MRPSSATWPTSFQECISKQSVTFQDGHLSQGQPSVCSPDVSNLFHCPWPSPCPPCSFSSAERLVAGSDFSLLPSHEHWCFKSLHHHPACPGQSCTLHSDKHVSDRASFLTHAQTQHLCSSQTHFVKPSGQLRSLALPGL